MNSWQWRDARTGSVMSPSAYTRAPSRDRLRAADTALFSPPSRTAGGTLAKGPLRDLGRLFDPNHAVLAQQVVDPRVVELATSDGGGVRRLGLRTLGQPLEQIVDDVARNDDYAVRVADDQVARLHHDAAGGDRIVDLARTAVERADRRHALPEDREVAERADAGEVADQAVDEETGGAAVTRLRRDQVAEHGGHGRSARVNDHHVAGLQDVEALVHHQVVAGVDLHRAGGADQLDVRIGESLDRRLHRVEPVHHVADGRRVEGMERGHGLRARALDVGADAEPGAGVHLG